MKRTDPTIGRDLKRGGLVIGGLLLLAIGCSGCDGSSSVDTTTTAADAAQVGDIVTIRYPASTIMCGERNDASAVYVAGELALRQTLRVENSAMKAVEAGKAARKAVLAKSYSCEWAPDKGRYIVKDKQITGDDNALFHVAEYCLTPQATSSGKCWWISASAKMNAQIDRLPAAKEAGR